MKHFVIEYSKRINEILHSYLISTWFYKHQIFGVSELCTAILINYDNQEKDEFEVFDNTDWDRFLKRMSRIKPDWIHFKRDIMESLAEQPHKVIGGWEGRTIYFIKAGRNPKFWTKDRAEIDTKNLLTATAAIQGPLIYEETLQIDQSIPVGREHFKQYEDFVRVTINYLFIKHLGEAKPQVRTEPGNESTEIRDLICQNRANKGFWKDLKDKYLCSEILIDAKNKEEISREDVRQIYCYLKPAIGLWGFIICRSKPSETIQAFNRTLFKNFSQKRGVLIISDNDLKKMIEIKMHGQEPSDYLHDKLSEFIRSI